MILGDGSLVHCKTEGSNSHIDFAHSIKQKEYAIWKAKILEQLTSVRITESVSKCKGKEYPIVRVLTKKHPLYTHLWRRFYHERRKTVDSFLMNQLTPLGLALWYQDDGNLKNHESYLTPMLETNCFNVAEHAIMTKALADNFHLEFRANHLNAKYLILRLRRKDREKFFDIIREFIHPTMAYKIMDDGKTVRPFGDPIKGTCEICGDNIITPFAKRARNHRFCNKCYNSHRSAIGTTRNQYSEPRDSQNPLAIAGAC